MSAPGKFVPRTNAERVAQKIVNRMWVLAGVIVLGCIASIPIGAAIDAADGGPSCGTYDFPQTVGNSTVYPKTAPKCVDGAWTVTNARKVMPEDAYGWNCYTDGDGACGALRPSVTGCLTDDRDGYTMCWDGRVFVLDGKRELYNVMREPVE